MVLGQPLFLQTFYHFLYKMTSYSIFISHKGYEMQKTLQDIINDFLNNLSSLDDQQLQAIEHLICVEVMERAYAKEVVSEAKNVRDM